MNNNVENRRFVKCLVICEDYSCEYSFETESVDSLKNDLIYEIGDDFAEVFDDTISSALESYHVDADDYLDYDEMSNNLYKSAEQYIENISTDKLVNVQVMSDYDIPSFAFSFPLSEVLINIIQYRSGDECHDVDIGRIVNKTLDILLEKGSWFSGLVSENEILINPNTWPAPTINGGLVTWEKNTIKYEPLLWFSVSGKINKRWSISKNIDENTFQFWFDIDDYNFSLEHILGNNINRSFEIWYFMECGFSIPNSEYIREKCPVTFPANSTVVSMNSAIDNYFLLKYKEAHNSK